MKKPPSVKWSKVERATVRQPQGMWTAPGRFDLTVKPARSGPPWAPQGNWTWEVVWTGESSATWRKSGRAGSYNVAKRAARKALVSMW